MLLPACTNEGRPLRPNSIFIGIQRARLPSREEFLRSLETQQVISIPAKFLGNWENLVGVVRQIREFTDGMLVFIDPRYNGSMLINWDRAAVWVAKQGSSGVLTVWTPNSVR